MERSHRVYVGTVGEGLFRSSDGGETFVRACDGMFVECHVRALAVHPDDPRTLYLGNELGLFRSIDGADHWGPVDSPVNDRQVWSILLSPHDPDLILVGTCPSRLFRSADGGCTWSEPAANLVQQCPRIVHSRVTALLADSANPGSFWAGVEIGGLYHSGDSGQTWQALGRGLSSQDIHGLVMADGRMLASTNNDLNVSLDGGATWQPLAVGRSLPWSYCRGLAQLPGQPGVILLGNGDGPPGTVGIVARSTDAGRTWQEARMPGRANSTVWTFALAPADPQLVYAASVSGEVYRSTNGGSSWDKLAREFGEIRALAWTL